MNPSPETVRPPVLALDHVDAAYGPFRALFDVSFAVGPTTATALLGPNGAGKTTVARLSSGLIRPTAGGVTITGTDISAMKAFQVARLGVAHAPEGRSVFASLTVEENLLLGFRNQSASGPRGGRHPEVPPPGDQHLDAGHGIERTTATEALAQAYELFPRLGDRSHQLAGSLSGGEQRMLSLARVMVDPPRLLIVDELSLGLAPIIVDEVYANLATVKARGTALLIIEQHVSHALELADQVVILDRGHTSYVGPALPVDQLATHLLPSGR